MTTRWRSIKAKQKSWTASLTKAEQLPQIVRPRAKPKTRTKAVSPPKLQRLQHVQREVNRPGLHVLRP